MRRFETRREVLRSSLPLLRAIAEQYAAMLGGKARDHRQKAEALLRSCLASATGPKPLASVN